MDQLKKTLTPQTKYHNLLPSLQLLKHNFNSLNNSVY
jgi:hypothetical protein